MTSAQTKVFTEGVTRYGGDLSEMISPEPSPGPQCEQARGVVTQLLTHGQVSAYIQGMLTLGHTARPLAALNLVVDPSLPA